MTQKKIDLLDWLKMGVLNSVITEKKAQDLYEAVYAKMKRADFLRMLYEG